MKKLLAFAALLAVVAFTSCKYDDDDLWNSVHGLENRVAKLEELCKQMNTNISSLQTIVTALQNNIYVTGTAPLMQDGKEIGYTITFSKGNPITIYHGKDGQDGEDGTTPTIGVKKDTDGVYYWTLNGEFLVVDGGKIKAEGKDGTNGTNGTTPQFKIENDYWFVSYDNGANWTQLGKATGEDGVGGDSMFSGVDYATSTDYVIFTLSNGTQIKLPTWSAFEALQRLCNETNANLSALQTIVTALQNNDYITSVDPLTENGTVVGYTIKFAKSNPIVIYNGKDGADGVDGNTPVIGVKKDTDGIYYWTLDGEFIVVDGQKIKAQGTDGNNGVDGSDGVTPKLEIREGYWWISYDNGTNWTQLGKATGEDGKDGLNGDSVFKGVTQDDKNVYFELADSTIITIAKFSSTEEDVNNSQIIQFEDAKVKAICVQNWDTNKDGELSHGEAAKVASIRKFFRGTTIQSFDELQYFTGIDEIGTDAFRQCKNLTNITIPQNVLWIEEYAFSGCNSLNDIIIPKYVTWIGAYTFNGCNNLTNIIIPNGVTTIGATAFLNCNRLENITIPNSVTTLGNSAFQGCANLTTAIISNNITIIANSTFSGCNNLTKIVIPQNVTSIGSNAFFNCTSLTTIEIPASMETLETNTFTQCTSLQTVTFEKGSKLKTIKDYVFHNCTSLTSIKIPASVETIRDNAFAGCTALTTVDMSACTQVTEIGDAAFYNDSKLQLFKIGTRTPPSCGYDVFTGINSYSVLKVPAGCIDAYKKAEGWNEFATISELDE